jgi:hypothetical protein
VNRVAFQLFYLAGKGVGETGIKEIEKGRGGVIIRENEAK